MQDMQVGSSDSPCLLAPLFQGERESARSKSCWQRSEQPLTHMDFIGSCRKGLEGDWHHTALATPCPWLCPCSPQPQLDEDSEGKNFSKR